MHKHSNKPENHDDGRTSKPITQLESINRPTMGLADERAQTAIVDNRSANLLQRKSAKPESIQPVESQLFAPLQRAQNDANQVNSDKSDSIKSNTGSRSPITVKQLKQNLSGLHSDESTQFANAPLKYQPIYAESLPTNLGIEGSQNPLAQTAQLQALGITGYTASTESAAEQPILQLVRTPEGLQTQLYTGSHVVVTQMHIGHDIWKGIKKAGAVAKKYSTSLLLAAESLLTITAGIAGCTVNPVGGIVAIVVGILKGIRAILAFLDTKEDGADPEAVASRKKWADAIRGVEAGLALIMALVGLPNPDLSVWTKATSTIFASVKSMRSLLILCGADKYTLGKKIINGLQLVEGASVLTGGFAAATSSSATAVNKTMGSMGVLVGASKGVRGAQGMSKAMKSTNVEDAENASQSDLEAGIHDEAQQEALAIPDAQPDDLASASSEDSLSEISQEEVADASPEELKKIARGIAEDIGFMYGGWSQEQIDAFAESDEGLERARIRLENMSSPTPSYIS